MERSPPFQTTLCNQIFFFEIWLVVGLDLARFERNLARFQRNLARVVEKPCTVSEKLGTVSEKCERK